MIRKIMRHWHESQSCHYSALILVLIIEDLLRFDYPSAVLPVDDVTRDLAVSPKAFSRLGSMLAMRCTSSKDATVRVLAFTGSCFQIGIVCASKDFEDLVCSERYSGPGQSFEDTVMMGLGV